MLLSLQKVPAQNVQGWHLLDLQTESRSSFAPSMHHPWHATGCCSVAGLMLRTGACTGLLATAAAVGAGLLAVAEVVRAVGCCPLGAVMEAGAAAPAEATDAASPQRSHAAQGHCAHVRNESDPREYQCTAVTKSAQPLAGPPGQW